MLIQKIPINVLLYKCGSKTEFKSGRVKLYNSKVTQKVAVAEYNIVFGYHLNL